MKTYALLVTVVLFQLFYKPGMAQTRKEVVQWLNNSGEEYLRDITGNSLAYWELEYNGTLKITNHKVDSIGTNKVIRKYSYLNLYELSSEESLIIADRKPKQFVLRCRSKAGNCIKTRYYYTNTSFKMDASSSILFNLENKFDERKSEELESKLLLAIQLVNEDVGSN